MILEVWKTMNLKENLEMQCNDLKILLETTIDVINASITNEGVFKATVNIYNLDELIELSKILDDNIVVYGVDSNIIMTVDTMRELGLD